MSKIISGYSDISGTRRKLVKVYGTPKDPRTIRRMEQTRRDGIGVPHSGVKVTGKRSIDGDVVSEAIKSVRREILVKVAAKNTVAPLLPKRRI